MTRQHAMNPQSKRFPDGPTANTPLQRELTPLAKAARRALAVKALGHLIAARDLFKRIEAERTVARVRLAISSARGAVRHAPNHKPKAEPLDGEVRHDLHGFYYCTFEEAEHEDAGNNSAGFDGRPHFSSMKAATAYARRRDRKGIRADDWMLKVAR